MFEHYLTEKDAIKVETFFTLCKLYFVILSIIIFTSIITTLHDNIRFVAKNAMPIADAVIVVVVIMCTSKRNHSIAHCTESTICHSTRNVHDTSSITV